MTALEQLKQFTTVVADTGDFHLIGDFRPQDATTNPSLILKAVKQPTYRALLDGVLANHRQADMDEVVDRLLVAFGLQILALIPGRVSTEVDARLSFDTDATVARARRIIAWFAEAGIAKERVLIKIAATWEGIQAAAVLEQEGIHCNLTLLFSKAQAVACGQAKVQLISPFVGRIYDWYKAKAGRDLAPFEDPGVQSVTEIYRYFKANAIATEVMGASFRTTDQIMALAGCDLLTISPDLLAKLAADDSVYPRVLAPTGFDVSAYPSLTLDEKSFRYMLNDDAMATEKLAEGIRLFARDTLSLESMIQQVR